MNAMMGAAPTAFSFRRRLSDRDVHEEQARIQSLSVLGKHMLVALSPVCIFVALFFVIVVSWENYAQQVSHSAAAQRCEWANVASMPHGMLRSRCMMEISSAFFH
ncbi:hypothetical protein AB1Y20_008317 [Prymnesium parvum]|uniref:Autophagy-related protein 9 n=1 Tax=Prymnesium parvum TaxID=97485 RepID=A0AB34ITF0_PRYPA